MSLKKIDTGDYTIYFSEDGYKYLADYIRNILRYLFYPIPTPMSVVYIHSCRNFLLRWKL